MVPRPSFARHYLVTGAFGLTVFVVAMAAMESGARFVQADAPAPARTIVIYNIPRPTGSASMDSVDPALLRLLEEHGPVTNARLVHSGNAWWVQATYKSHDVADVTREALNGVEFKGRRLAVELKANKRESDTAREAREDLILQQAERIRAERAWHRNVPGAEIDAIERGEPLRPGDPGHGKPARTIRSTARPPYIGRMVVIYGARGTDPLPAVVNAYRDDNRISATAFSLDRGAVPMRDVVYGPGEPGKWGWPDDPDECGD